MTTYTVIFKNGNTAEVENAFDYDDDGYKSEPHLFFYDVEGKVICSFPYNEVDSVR